jgi:hypothetical protein
MQRSSSNCYNPIRMVDEIVSLLRDPKTREALAERWRGIHYRAMGISEERGTTIEDEFNDAIYEVERYEERPTVFTILQERVLERINAPLIITLQELTEELFSVLSHEPAPCSDFDDLFPAYINRIRSLLSERTCIPFPVSQLSPLPWPPFPEDEHPGGDTASAGQFEIWSRNGVSIGSHGIGLAEFDARYTGHYPELLYSRVKGRISPRALEILGRDLNRTLPSLVRSCLATVLPLPGSHVQGTIIWTALVDPTRPFTATGLPIADVELVRGEVPFLRDCLDCYFAKPSSKDSLDRRIRNAVTVLMEADAQQSHAVGIALSVTAIEALLGTKSNDISASLRDHVPVLLEPELERRHHAGEFMKKVYDDRSRVLHGERLDAAERRRAEVRLLAAGVLYVVVNRVGFMRRGGFDPQRPDELLQELREGKYRSGQPTGVPSLPRVWKMWRELPQPNL